jgi:Protein of unknown function (DUF1549)/Protein of unknown function (DUF1553)
MTVMRPARLVVIASLLAMSCASQPTPTPAKAAPTASAAPSASVASATAPAVDASAIDAAIRAEWTKQGITPSTRADDARFLRRAYVDIVGAIPPADAVVAFLADTSPDKRAKVVDALLASPAYAEHWATYWDDVLIGRALRDAAVDQNAFHAWLRDEFAKNAPWNTLVYDLMTATGQNSVGGKRNGYVVTPASSAMAAPMASAMDDDDGPGGAAAATVNGAVNWTLKYANTPQDLAGSAAKTFLGVQIQCAQCHDHKTEKWKQTDFEKFANCFTRTRLVRIDTGPAMGNVRRVELRDLEKPAPRFRKNEDTKDILPARPTTLEGGDLSQSKEVREAIAAWFVDAKNPWFAEEMVNRMWGHMVGRGFVDPVDDIRPSNPATMQPLLDQLATDFVAHKYDLRYLIREIAATEVYQLSTAPTANPKEKLEAEHKLWARFRMAPLGPEELIASVLRATDLEDAVRKNPKLDMDKIRLQLAKSYGFLFDVDEELDHDSFDGTITQALTLLNGAFVGGGSSDLPGGALAAIMAAPGDDASKIAQLYLRTVSRPPSADEVAFWQKYVADAQTAPAAAARPKPKGDALERLAMRGAAAAKDPRTQAFEDMFWALINSSEFVFNH